MSAHEHGGAAADQHAETRGSMTDDQRHAVDDAVSAIYRLAPSLARRLDRVDLAARLTKFVGQLESETRKERTDET